MNQRASTSFICILGGALLLSACVGPATIRGRDVDQTGAPIKGAAIETIPPTDVVITRANGYFALKQILNDQGESLPIPSGRYQLRITKDGLEDLERHIEVEGGDTTLADSEMQERKPEVKPTAPDALPDRKVTAIDVSTPVGGGQ